MSPQRAVPKACRPRTALLSGRAKWAPALKKRLPRRPGAAHRPLRLRMESAASLPPPPRAGYRDLRQPPPLAPMATPAPTGAGVSQVLLGRPRLRPKLRPQATTSSPAPTAPPPPRAPKLRPRGTRARKARPGRSSERRLLEKLSWSTRLVRPEWARGGREQGRIKMAVQVVQAVQAVHLESDAFLVCLNHALSTEKEEVMGLCIGEVSRSFCVAGTLLAVPSSP